MSSQKTPKLSVSSLSLLFFCFFTSASPIQAQADPPAALSEERAQETIADYTQWLAQSTFDELASTAPEFNEYEQLSPEARDNLRRTSWDATKFIIYDAKISASSVVQKLLVEHPDIFLVRQIFKVVKMTMILPYLGSHGYLHLVAPAFFILNPDILAGSHYALKVFLESRKMHGRFGHSAYELSRFKKANFDAAFGEKLGLQQFSIDEVEHTVQVQQRTWLQFLGRLWGQKPSERIITTQELESLIEDKNFLKQALEFKIAPDLYHRILIEAALRDSSAKPKLLALFEKKKLIQIEASSELQGNLQKIDALRTHLELKIFNARRAIKAKITGLNGSIWSWVDPKTYSVKMSLAEISGEMANEYRKLRNLEAELLSDAMDGKRVEESSFTESLTISSNSIEKMIENLDAYQRGIENSKDMRAAAEFAEKSRSITNTVGQGCANVYRSLVRSWF